MRYYERILLVKKIEDEINTVIDVLEMSPVLNSPTPTFCQYGACPDDAEVVAGDLTVYIIGSVDISDLLSINNLIQKWKYLQIYRMSSDNRLFVSSQGEIVVPGTKSDPVVTMTKNYTLKNYSNSVIDLDKDLIELPFEVEIVNGEE